MKSSTIAKIRAKLLLIISSLMVLACFISLLSQRRQDPSKEPNEISMRREMPQSARALTQSQDSYLSALTRQPAKHVPPPVQATASASRAVIAFPMDPAVARNDRMEDAVLMEVRDAPSNQENEIERTKMFQTDFKYPLIRVVERIAVDPSTGEETVASSTAMVASHVLAQLAPDATEKQLLELAARKGIRLKELPHTEGLYILSIPEPGIDSVPDAIALLRRDRQLLTFVEPDFIVYADGTIPNDPRFNELWGMHNIGQSGGTADADVDGPEAWDINTGNNTIVAVIDTGVDYLHEDLAANMWTNPGEIAGNGIDDDGNGHVDDIYGIDAYNNDSDPADDHGHGTHCSGTIAGIGDNNIGVAGVCWRARIMALKFLSSGGRGSSSDAITCIDYAISKGAVVMNNSWGGGGYSSALFAAIERARIANSLFVAAAGNSAVDNDLRPHYPSSYTNDNVLAVASSTRHDSLSGFSCYGAVSVDLAAPGSAILSCLPGDRYDSWNGTSMATPHVAGAAALLAAQNPSFLVSDLKKTIVDNVDPIPAFAGKMVTGGRLNVYKALSSVFGVTFDRPDYFVDTWATLTLTDTDFAGASSQTIALSTDSGDSEVLTLYPKTPGDYIFTNRVYIAYGAASPASGLLEGVHGTALYASYLDPSSGNTVTGSAVIVLSLAIKITTPETAVPFTTTNFAVAGTNNGTVLVSMTASNESTGGFASFSGTNSWTAPLLSLATNTGRNVIHVFGTNVFGFADSDSVVIRRYGPPSSTNYVSPSGGHSWPHTSWATAATNINAAVTAAAAGNLVLVTNGTYDAETVIVTRPMTIRSVNGPLSTVIHGKYRRGCVSVTGDALLDGFSLTGGSADDGAGAYLTEGELRNCRLYLNFATDSGGGAFVTGSGSINSCIVSNNTAYYGGGIALDTDGSASNCLIVTNTAYSYGGGARCNGGGVISFSTIRDNEAGSRGGGVECREGGTLYSCTIIGNQSGYDGGGVELYYRGAAGSVYNSFIANNTATRYGGGANFRGGGDIYNCTIVGNAGGTGGGLYCDSGGRIRNSIVFYNSSTDGGNYKNAGAPNQIYEYVSTYPLPAGTGNMTNQPLVAGMNDSHLLPGSPCINAGNNRFAAGSDIEGEARIMNGTVDIGCDEHSGITTGPLVVAIQAAATNVVPNYAVEFESVISGMPSSFTWSFGGGPLTTNQPIVTHSWPAAGSYPVVLTVYNTDNPGGIAATATVQVIDTTQYVSPSGSHTAPYDSWAKAANDLQSAVDVAPHGGTVYVTNGIYNTSGYSLGKVKSRVGLNKPVSLLSINGPEYTFIVGQGPVGTSAVKCVYMSTGALVSGFTLTNGHTLAYGGTPPELYGGGAYMDGGGTISNCIIAGNSSRYRAGGIYFSGGGTAVNSIIRSNYARNYGGGVYMDRGGSLKHCTAASNSTLYFGGGLYCYYGTEIINSIIYHNTGRYGANIRTYGTAVDYKFTCTYPTTLLPSPIGCFTNDPMLANTSALNFHLREGSPCIDTASTIAGIDRDLDGFTRPMDGDSNGVAIADIGAYEFLPMSIDTDGDGMPDAWEIANGLDRFINDAAGDLDSDGLSNLHEYINGADPNVTDTDGDGFNDLIEVQTGSDPADAASTPLVTVTITAPTAAATYATTNATINLAGTLAARAAVASMSVSNNRHIFAASCPVSASWSFTNMPLYSGRNHIKVSATDIMSNAVSDTIIVDRTGDSGYNDLLYSGAIVQDITMADNLLPGTTVPVQWKTLSYMPLRAQLGTGSKAGGWYLFKNARCLGVTGSPWNIKGRNASVYSYQADFVVPTNQGNFSIWFAHGQMDGRSYMSAVIPDGVDPRPDLVQSKLITRTIVAGGTNASPASDTRYTDTTNPFESTTEALMRSGGTIINVNIPTNSWSVNNMVNCQWTVLSYRPIWSTLLMLDVSNRVVHLQTLGSLTGSRASSWRLGATYATEYDFQANITIPTNAVGTQQLYFLNMQQGVSGASWMAGNIPAGKDPRPSLYNGMYGRFIDRTVTP